MTGKAIRACALLFALGGVAATPAARATPLDDPHVGGVGFSGPTVGDLAAVYWNPAALALLDGNHFRLSTTFRHDTINVSRSPTAPLTGQSPGSRSHPEVSGSGHVQPARWPPGPGSFLGLGIDVGGRFTLAVAGYVPFFERLRFDPRSDGALPTRYHAVDIDLRNYALVTALAFRVGRRLRVGVAPGFLFPAGVLTVDQDTALAGGQASLQADCGGMPCGVEHPNAAARYDLRGNLGPFNSKPAFTIGGGILYEFDAWTLGLSYTSRPLGRDNNGVEIDLPASAITLPATLGGQSLCHNHPGAGIRSCVDGRLGYRLPDIYIAGIGVRLGTGWALQATGRYLAFSRHENLAIRLSGPPTSALGSPQLPSRLIIRRGFHDMVDVRTMMSYLIPNGVQLGGGVRVSTGAVPASHLTPAAVDGFTIEPTLAASIRLSWLSLSAGYALGWLLPRNVTSAQSAFDPGAAVACADSGRDLQTTACQTDLQGAARPGTAGRYQRTVHSFSLNATAHF